MNLILPIKKSHPEVSIADLIVLSSTLALSQSLNNAQDLEDSFCPGRVDDNSGEAWKLLKPRVVGNKGESVDLIKDYIEVMGLNQHEFIALMGVGYSIGDISGTCQGLFCRFEPLLDVGKIIKLKI